MRWFIETKAITISTGVKMWLARQRRINSSSRDIGGRGHLGWSLKKTLACESCGSTNIVNYLFLALGTTGSNRILCKIIGEGCPRPRPLLWSLDYSTNPFELTDVTSGRSACPVAATGLMREARVWDIRLLSRTSLSFLLLRGVSGIFPTVLCV